MNDRENTPQAMTNSHILVNTFDYYEPETVAEAASLLVEHGGRAKVMAGGTDLLVQMKIERIAPQVLVSLSRIPGLDRIEVRDGSPRSLHIGARASIMAVERLAPVRSRFQALAEACANFSSTQVQTMGTLGGNLGNASPAADSAPSLIAFGAELELTGTEGVRRLPVEEFFKGPGKSVLKAGELITSIVLPEPRAGTGSAFAKVSRVTNDIAKANCAVVIVRGEGNLIVDCRMAFGSVAPTPVRARDAERLLVGQVWSEELVDRAAGLAAQEVSPIDDVRSTASYRRDVVRVMVSDGLRWAWQRAECCDDDGGWDLSVGSGRVALGGLRAGADTTSRVPEPGNRRLPAGNNQTPGHAHKLAADEKRLVEFRVNGRLHRVWVSPHDLLLNVLRNDLELTGTKYGCGIGECSACTVLMDGRPVLACLVLAVAAEGHEIVTIEGIAAPDGTLDPLQEAFIDYGAYQCGYCTPGQIITAKSLLAEKPRPTEDDVRHYMRGNMCRCTGYAAITRAVLAAAEKTKDE